MMTWSKCRLQSPDECIRLFEVVFKWRLFSLKSRSDTYMCYKRIEQYPWWGDQRREGSFPICVKIRGYDQHTHFPLRAHKGLKTRNREGGARHGLPSRFQKMTFETQRQAVVGYFNLFKRIMGHSKFI